MQNRRNRGATTVTPAAKDTAVPASTPALPPSHRGRAPTNQPPPMSLPFSQDPNLNVIIESLDAATMSIGTYIKYVLKNDLKRSNSKKNQDKLALFEIFWKDVIDARELNKNPEDSFESFMKKLKDSLNCFVEKQFKEINKLSTGKAELFVFVRDVVIDWIEAKQHLRMLVQAKEIHSKLMVNPHTSLMTETNHANPLITDSDILRLINTMKESTVAHAKTVTDDINEIQDRIQEINDRTITLSRYHEQITELKAKKATLENDLVTAKNLFREINPLRQLLKAELASDQATAETIRTARVNLKNKCAEYNTAYTKYLQEVREHNKKIESKQFEPPRLQKITELNALKTLIAEANTLLTRKKKTAHDNLAGIHTNFKQISTELDAFIEILRTSNKSLTDNINKLPDPTTIKTLLDNLTWLSTCTATHARTDEINAVCTSQYSETGEALNRVIDTIGQLVRVDSDSLIHIPTGKQDWDTLAERLNVIVNDIRKKISEYAEKSQWNEFSAALKNAPKMNNTTVIAAQIKSENNRRATIAVMIKDISDYKKKFMGEAMAKNEYGILLQGQTYLASLKKIPDYEFSADIMQTDSKSLRVTTAPLIEPKTMSKLSASLDKLLTRAEKQEAEITELKNYKDSANNVSLLVHQDLIIKRAELEDRQISTLANITTIKLIKTKKVDCDKSITEYKTTIDKIKDAKNKKELTKLIAKANKLEIKSKALLDDIKRIKAGKSTFYERHPNLMRGLAIGAGVTVLAAVAVTLAIFLTPAGAAAVGAVGGFLAVKLGFAGSIAAALGITTAASLIPPAIGALVGAGADKAIEMRELKKQAVQAPSPSSSPSNAASPRTSVREISNSLRSSQNSVRSDADEEIAAKQVPFEGNGNYDPRLLAQDTVSSEEAKVAMEIAMEVAMLEKIIAWYETKETKNTSVMADLKSLLSGLRSDAENSAFALGINVHCLTLQLKPKDYLRLKNEYLAENPEAVVSRKLAQ